MTVLPSKKESQTIWPEWENEGVPPPKLFVHVAYKDGRTNKVRQTWHVYWIGGSVSNDGVTSLSFDQRGKAVGVARPLYGSAS